MRAFVYFRVSTVDQEYSPEAQQKQGEAYCFSRSAAVVDVFDDSGVSGKIPFAQRPDGKRLLDRIDEADMIVFSKLDRAFRDTVDCIMTVEMLHSLGKTVVFLDLGVDTSTPGGALCMEVMAAFAKFERRRIGERTSEALSIAKERGIKIGPAPFGYDNIVEFNPLGDRVNRGKHRRNDSEWAIVARVLDLSRGYGPTRIAEILNADGVPTRLGGRWSGNHIIRMLKREAAR